MLVLDEVIHLTHLFIWLTLTRDLRRSVYLQRIYFIHTLLDEVNTTQWHTTEKIRLVGNIHAHTHTHTTHTHTHTHTHIHSLIALLCPDSTILVNDPNWLLLFQGWAVSVLVCGVYFTILWRQIVCRMADEQNSLWEILFDYVNKYVACFKNAQILKLCLILILHSCYGR